MTSPDKTNRDSDSYFTILVTKPAQKTWNNFELGPRYRHEFFKPWGATLDDQKRRPLYLRGFSPFLPFRDLYAVYESLRAIPTVGLGHSVAYAAHYVLKFIYDAIALPFNIVLGLVKLFTRTIASLCQLCSCIFSGTPVGEMSASSDGAKTVTCDSSKDRAVAAYHVVGADESDQSDQSDQSDEGDDGELDLSVKDGPYGSLT